MVEAQNSRLFTINITPGIESSLTEAQVKTWLVWKGSWSLTSDPGSGSESTVEDVSARDRKSWKFDRKQQQKKVSLVHQPRWIFIDVVMEFWNVPAPFPSDQQLHTCTVGGAHETDTSMRGRGALCGHLHHVDSRCYSFCCFDLCVLSSTFRSAVASWTPQQPCLRGAGRRTRSATCL